MTTPGDDGGPTEPFAVLLEDLIRRADMTIPEVAKATGLDDQTIRTYLSGSRQPRLPSVRKLEAVLPDPSFSMRRALGHNVPDPIDEDVPAEWIEGVQGVSMADLASVIQQLADSQAEVLSLVRELTEEVRRAQRSAGVTPSERQPRSRA